MHIMSHCILICSSLVFCLFSSCVTSKKSEREFVVVDVKPESHEYEENKIEEKPIDTLLEVHIDLRANSKNYEDEKGQIKAEVYRPVVHAQRKTLVIMVPGSGKVSRRGEMLSDGINRYSEPVELYKILGQKLSELGLYVLSYDKRSCTSQNNSLCLEQSLKSADEVGIEMLSRDLEDVYAYVQEKIPDLNDWHVVLLGHAQATQVIALSKIASLVQGVVLLSPIIGSMEQIVSDTLARVKTSHNALSKRPYFLNDAENKIAFFKRLAGGQHDDATSFFGATVKFWKSWMTASNNTLQLLNNHKRPIIMLFGEKDVYSSAGDTIKNIEKKYGKNSCFIVKNIKNSDKNLIDNNEISQEAVSIISSFLKS